MVTWAPDFRDLDLWITDSKVETTGWKGVVEEAAHHVATKNQRKGRREPERNKRLWGMICPLKEHPSNLLPQTGHPLVAH